MVEIDNRAELELLAPLQLRNLESSLTDLADTAEVFGGSAVEISELEFRLIATEIQGVIDNAAQVCRVIVNEGLGRESFFDYVSKKVFAALEPLKDDSIESSGGNSSVVGLNISSFVYEYLSLTTNIALSQKRDGAGANLADLSKNYFFLQNHDTAKLVGFFKDLVGALPSAVPSLDVASTDTTDHPELLVQELPYLAEASLSTEELNGLKKVLKDLDSSWLHADVLKLLLRKSILSSDGLISDVASQFSKLEDLRLSLVRTLVDARNLQASPDTFLTAEFHLSEKRIEELLKVIDQIKQPDNRLLDNWKKTFTDTFVKNETGDLVDITYLTQLRIKKASGIAFSPEETEGLEDLVNYITGVRANINLVDYSTNNDTYNQRINQEKRRIIDELLSNVTELLAVTVPSPENEVGEYRLTEPQRRVLVAYNEVLAPLIEFLPRSQTPDADSIIEQLRTVEPRQFMAGLISAILRKYLEEIKAKTSSEGTGYPLIVQKSTLLSAEEMLRGSGVLEDEERTFEFFLNNFPWKVVLNVELTNAEELKLNEHMYDVMIARVVYMQSIQNLAFDIGKPAESELQESKQLLTPIKTYINQEDSSTIDHNYSYYSAQKDLSHDDPQVEEALIELFSSTEEPIDDLWIMPNLAHTFFVEIRKSFKESRQSLPHKKNGKNLEALLNEVEAQHIPPEVKNNPYYTEQIRVARNLGAWLAIARLDTFFQDSEAITAKYSRLSNWGGVDSYGVKLFPLATETGERCAPSSVTQVERFVLQPDQFQKCLVRIPRYGWEEIDAQQYYDLTKLVVKKGRFFSSDTVNEADSRTRAIALAAGLNIPVPSAFDKRKLSRFRRKSSVIAHKDERIENIDDDINTANFEAFKQRYAILRIDPEFQSFDTLGGGVVIIPRSWLSHATKHGYIADYLPMSLADVSEGMIDQSLVEPKSITSKHKEHLDLFVGNFTEVLYKLGLDPDIGDVHELKKDFVRRREEQFGRMPFDIGIWLTFFGMNEGIVDSVVRYSRSKTAEKTDGPELERAAYEEMDENLRRLISIKQIPDDWVTRDVDEGDDPLSSGGLGLAKVTKYLVKYGLLRSADSGWNYPVRGAWENNEVKTLEDVAEFLREDSKLTIREMMDKAGFELDPVKNVTIHAAEPKYLRPEMNLPGNKGVRIAVDLFDQALSEAGDEATQLRKKAQNYLNLELFMVVIRTYLDRFIPQTFISGKEVKITGDSKMDYDVIQCYMAKKPMSFIDREFFLAFCDAAFISLYSRDPAPDLKYTREDIIDEMVKRGIVGSREQFITDRYIYQTEFQQLGAVDDKKK